MASSSADSKAAVPSLAKADGPPFRILITGASGLLGRALMPAFESELTTHAAQVAMLSLLASSHSQTQGCCCMAAFCTRE
jgi:hypothetical protein